MSLSAYERIVHHLGGSSDPASAGLFFSCGKANGTSEGGNEERKDMKVMSSNTVPEEIMSDSWRLRGASKKEKEEHGKVTMMVM